MGGSCLTAKSRVLCSVQIDLKKFKKLLEEETAADPEGDDDDGGKGGSKGGSKGSKGGSKAGSKAGGDDSAQGRKDSERLKSKLSKTSAAKGSKAGSKAGGSSKYKTQIHKLQSRIKVFVVNEQTFHGFINILFFISAVTSV